MSHQITKVDLIPSGELSVCNVSQFDNGRVLPFEILENNEAYNIPNDIRVELHCRKADGNIVTLPSENIANNIVTFLSTTQLTACYGKNICEIALYGPDDYLIGSSNFILEVEKSPTLGGINSTSVIHDLEDQIEEITTEIIGEDYYNKTQVDNKLDLKANAADVYTKSQVDSALANKANAADVYTKSQVDSALANKANAADVYTKSQVDSALAHKANAADVYTKQEVDNKILDIMPVDTASGPIATFDTELNVPLVEVKCEIKATGGNGTADNPNPINGYTEANITRCGVNLWDEEWEVGTINNNTGALVPNGSIIRSKNFIPISGGVTILLYATNISNMWLRVFEYDKNKNFIASDAKYTETTYQLNANTAYLKFYMKSDYGKTYNKDISILYPSNITPAYHPYTGNTYTIAFGQTVYGGVLDVTKGKLKPCIEYPSYNGETLSGRWLSSEATYVEGTTPPIGSQVVSLDDYGTDIDLTPEVISAIVGTNNVYTDTNGDTTVQYKDTIQNYIDKKVSI